MTFFSSTDLFSQYQSFSSARQSLCLGGRGAREESRAVEMSAILLAVVFYHYRSALQSKYCKYCSLRS